MLDDRHCWRVRAQGKRSNFGVLWKLRGLYPEKNSKHLGGNYRTKKIFVGGLPSTLTEEQFRQYFESYGDVTDTFHELNNKLVEVKRALPKDANPGGGGGGGYQGNNAGSFDSQMDSNRFMQQNSGGGYPAYSGYGQPSYGFGAPNGGAGYGSYGVGGYGGPAGAYGNPNVGSSPNALKSPWLVRLLAMAMQAMVQMWATVLMFFGMLLRVAAVELVVVQPVGQSPSGGSSYANQGYGYGVYGTSDGYNTSSGGYAAAGSRSGPGGAANSMAASGGDQQGHLRPYNGQPDYSNAAWRSDS
ncbi:hypothetical protein L1987_21986 [Smallanthus sonchifolius]|uniref:Uncharacterized protein n=1 Tax=Smallanthus sonchifolius TaxID=185202 RepID=A0ACB9ICW5_9ASTR|nr:hypothetical protein L1987_21986 [Smallanthus sonchifolius]